MIADMTIRTFSEKTRHFKDIKAHGLRPSWPDGGRRLAVDPRQQRHH